MYLQTIIKKFLKVLMDLDENICSLFQKRNKILPTKLKMFPKQHMLKFFTNKEYILLRNILSTS